MVELDFENLFVIAQAEPVFTQVQLALHARGETRLVAELVKLQQDATVAINREMWDFDETPAPDNADALARSVYEPVTSGRLDLLRVVAAQIAPVEIRLAPVEVRSDHAELKPAQPPGAPADLRDLWRDLMNRLPMPPAAPAPRTAARGHGLT